MLQKLSSFLKSVWLYFPGIFTVILLYVMLVDLEQGIDLLIQSGESWLHLIWICIAIFIWSMISWYSARLVSYSKENTEKTVGHNHKTDIIGPLFHKHIPRLIAWNCFACVQSAIVFQVFADCFSDYLKLNSGSHLQLVLIIGFLIVHNLLYFLLIINWEKGRKKWVILVYTFIYGYIFFWLWKGVFHSELESYMHYRYRLCILAALLFIFQISTLRYFIVRRKSLHPSLNKTYMVSMIAMNPAQASEEQSHFLRFNIISGVACCIYLLAIFSMTFSRYTASLSLLLISLSLFSGFGAIISCVSLRVHFNLNVVLILLAFVIGWIVPAYDVKLQKSNIRHIYAGRTPVKEYFKRWINKRRNLIDSTKDFDVYIVLSDGGGSRAGDWVSGVLSKIQERSELSDPGNDLSKHLLCLAGASGGSVGNCAFYSLLKSHLENENKNFLTHSQQFFMSDFLSPTLIRLLGPDYLRHIFPFPMDDRAKALESAMENSGDSLISSYFKKPFQDVIDTSGSLPFLFINTTSVRDGMPAEISATKIPINSQRIDVLDLVDSSGDCHKKGILNFSTAAVLSSRFPYVAPAGNIMGYYFVDGGYFDNSGAGVVLELMQELEGKMNDTTDLFLFQYRNKLRLNILHISNSKIPDSTINIHNPKMHPLMNDLLAPVLTIVGMGGSTTTVGDGTLKNYFSTIDKDHRGLLIPVSLYDSTKTAFPVSWIISQYNFHLMNLKMDSALKSVYPKLKLK
jgi:predicted acylesterase/phospholipase RssA